MWQIFFRMESTEGWNRSFFSWTANEELDAPEYAGLEVGMAHDLISTTSMPATKDQ